MGRVTIRPGIGRDVALMFGPSITLAAAEEAAVMVKMQMGVGTVDDRNHAVARADLTDRIDVSVRPGHAQDHSVVLSVKGREGTEIASHLEFGYVNNRAGRRLAGMHSMRNVASKLKV